MATKPKTTVPEQLDEPEHVGPSGWTPAAGDNVTGTVVDIVAIESEYGFYPMLAIDTGERIVNVHAFHSLLREPLMKLKPSKGDKLSITYNGRIASKTRTDANDNPVKYHTYTVTDPDNPPAPFDWDNAEAGF